jgi:RNA polymerase sigma factor (sigma-70 family)
LGIGLLQRQEGQDTTSASLLLRVRDPADDRAWREFEARYSELIRRYSRRRGLSAADTDDVSQMVWSDLAKGLRNFCYDPKNGRFRSYLGKVVRSAIFRYFSRNVSNTSALDSAVLATSADDRDAADASWEKEWVDHHYRIAMETIEDTFEAKSVAIFRKLLGGDTTEQVAAEFNMTGAAVNQAKHRIRSRMKELIARQVREEDEPDTFATT